MKVYIDENEAFPIYSLSDDEEFAGLECHISEADFKRIQTVFAEFDAVQELLAEAYSKGKQKG